MTDRTPEALLARRALAEKATPGPWASYTNVEKVFGVTAYDWGKVYARVGEYVWAILTMNLNRLSPEEETEARAAFREGRGIDPGQPGRDARFIASNAPETVMADIDEILRLRAQVERLEREADCKAVKVDSQGDTIIILRLREEVECLRREVENLSGQADRLAGWARMKCDEVQRLEREADWLALVLANAGCGVSLTEYIGEGVNGMSPPAPEHWRSAARRECTE